MEGSRGFRWGGAERGVEHRGIDACISVGVAGASPSALTEILLSSLLSTILRPVDRAPRGDSRARMLERVRMGNIDEEFSRCGPSLDCPAGPLDALR